MAFSEIEKKMNGKLIGPFCDLRVPKKYQSELKHGYRFDRQNIFIFESRPRWDKPSEWIDMDLAKLTYVKSRGIWKLYWKRASGKWERYEPHKESDELSELMKTIDEDRSGCFLR